MTTPARADLTNLFQAPTQPEAFRQGVILSFDPATGANTVNVGGAVLTNLPILVGGDTVNFAEDDVVVLLKYRSSWAILGRIVIPGNEALTAAAVDFYAGNNWHLDPLTIDTTFAMSSHLSIPVPAWANSALVYASSNAVFANASGSTDTVLTETRLDGGSGGRADHQVPDTFFQSVDSFVARRIGVGGAGPLGSTIELDTWSRTNGFTWTGGLVRSFLNAIVVFRKV